MNGNNKMFLSTNFFLGTGTGTGTVMIYLEKIVFVLGGWVSTSDLLPQIEPQNQ